MLDRILAYLIVFLYYDTLTSFNDATMSSAVAVYGILTCLYSTVVISSSTDYVYVTAAYNHSTL